METQKPLFFVKYPASCLDFSHFTLNTVFQNIGSKKNLNFRPRPTASA